MGYPVPPVQPAKVERRNLRERNRVKQVNCGFDYLRSHIPGAAKQKKMSKVETLRHAVEYIQMLQKLLGEKAGGSVSSRDEEITKRVKLPTTSQPNTATSQPQPPPITSPLAIPTPSSTVSSEASTTPFEAVHFQYPSPLTPKTPTPYDPQRQLPSYESGYDTASFYSAASVASSSSSSFMATSPHSQQVNFCYPPSELSHPQQQQQQHAESYSSYDYYGAEAVNSEEDELLDVIARWQDQED